MIYDKLLLYLNTFKEVLALRLISLRIVFIAFKEWMEDHMNHNFLEKVQCLLFNARLDKEFSVRLCHM